MNIFDREHTAAKILELKGKTLPINEKIVPIVNRVRSDQGLHNNDNSIHRLKNVWSKLLRKRRRSGVIKNRSSEMVKRREIKFC